MFGFARRASLPYVHDLDAPLLALSPQDVWRLRDACEGTAIFGGTGSGKSSGSGRALAHAFLRAGFGGLVLCAKQHEERERWTTYARQTGRERSLIVFDASGERRFNFLEYEIARATAAGSLDIGNVVSLFMRIADAASTGTGRREEKEPFFRDATRGVLKNAILALWHGQGRLRLSEIMRMVDTGPSAVAQLSDPEWCAASFNYQTLRRMMEEPVHPLPREDAEEVAMYWPRMLTRFGAKTTGSIIATVATMLEPFLTGKMRDLFCTTTTIVPELTHEGAVFLVDLPVKQWHQTGIIAQHIVKYLWQRATESRAVTPATRPVFLWVDECQFFASEYDNEFQSTARASRACTVYLTQNLAGMYHASTAANPEYATENLFGNFQTKIFHANLEPKTNYWAVEMIGKSVQWRRNMGENESEGDSSGTSYGENVGANRGSGFGSARSTGRNRGANYNSTHGDNSWSSGSGWSRGTNEGASDSENRSMGKSRGVSTGLNQSRTRSAGRSMGASEVVDYHLQPAAFTTLRNGGKENNCVVDGIVVKGKRWKHSKSVWLPCEFAQV